MVINQCVVNEGHGDGDGDDDDDNGSREALKNYYERRKAWQNRWITKLKNAAADISASEIVTSKSRKYHSSKRS